MPEPYELLEPLEGPPLDLLIIGCGNLLRGDDALGPIVVRRMWEQVDLPANVRLLDAGTSGMDVVFQMRGALKVILIDACATGAEPGTVYQLSAADVETLPQPGTLGSHDFRWDHSLAFGQWLLGPLMPKDIEIYLVEAQNVAHGADLSEAAQAGALAVQKRIEAEVDRVRT